ncbi:hypothetical protein WJX73_003381 [Symbiochloris irregularis]|uniref:Glycoside hydrolase family 42 N-terminal domain-containing protein n=1 Tax=Symbiochloris irregularis TaxID=706552 RepID=A0AAW1PN55_9CHLO
MAQQWNKILLVLLCLLPLAAGAPVVWTGRTENRHFDIYTIGNDEGQVGGPAPSFTPPSRPLAPSPSQETVHYVNLAAKPLEVAFRPLTHTIVSLQAEGGSFNYVPKDGDFGINRSLPGAGALGDLYLRVRSAQTQQITLPPLPYLEPYPTWTTLSTSITGDPSAGVRELPVQPWELLADDLTPLLGPDSLPIYIERRYWQATDSVGGLIMSFTLHNRDNFSAVEIGALGLPLCFQGRWDGFSLEQMSQRSSFVDYHLGLQHGFATVTRMSGKGPVLLVTAENSTSFEAWRSNRDMAGCGPLWTPEWMVHSAAYKTEWQEAKPWNPMTAAILGPQENMTVGWRLQLASSLRQRDPALAAAGKAVLVGIPGYVLSTEMQSAKLLVTFPKGASAIAKIKVEPEGAIVPGKISATNSPRQVAIPLAARHYGQARLVLHFDDAASSRTVAHYFVLLPLKEHLRRFGEFQATSAWFATAAGQAPDPFGRAPSVMPWDRQAGRHVLQDPRAFVVGLSDEAGAGANVGLAVKVGNMPTQAEVARMDEYVHSTLWGVGVEKDIPFPVSLQDPSNYGIRAGLFWVPTPGSNETGMPGYNYLPSDFAGWIWNRDRSVGSLGRAYNYPHQTIVYWSLYKAASEHSLLVTRQPAIWYLQQACHTIMGMWQQARWYTQFGLMAGTVFREVLTDAWLEGLIAEAAAIHDIMYNRTNVGVTYHSGAPCPEPPGPCACHDNAADNTSMLRCTAWTDNPFPFGSEFAWDSTGQEEIFIWSKWFGFEETATSTLDAVLAFMPTLPNWAYNGGALGIGDFSNNAKLTPYGGWERPLTHYRAGLNAIPVLEAYLADPDDLHLLLTGIGGMAGGLTNIDLQGATSMGFHSDPALLQHDPYSGDYGIGFFGQTHLMTAAIVRQAFDR